MPNHSPPRVGILQRIVKAIAITIKVLAIVWHLHIVVGTEETTDNRIVQATVHIDYTILVEHLMTCIAPIKPDVVLRNGWGHAICWHFKHVNAIGRCSA